MNRRMTKRKVWINFRGLTGCYLGLAKQFGASGVFDTEYEAMHEASGYSESFCWGWE